MNARLFEHTAKIRETLRRRQAAIWIGCSLLLLPSTGAALDVERGPFLQQGRHDGVIVRWWTDDDTDSKLWYGTSPGNLNQTTEKSGSRDKHTLRITGLSPSTKYYYAVGNSRGVLTGGDAETYFVTSPLPGTAASTRIWVLGDAGEWNDAVRRVRDRYKSFTGARHTDLWLMLGDNAYEDGEWWEYDRAVFDMYPELLRQTPLWSTFGNHDARSADSGRQSGVYYDIFSFPRGGEVGGVPSGTEAYYSFDYGNIHFVCLDSQDSDREPDDDMLRWLEADLASTTKTWIIAFWHHPPYSKGTHDSDSSSDSGGRLRDMRENALPILEDYGVDLVLTGHSHSYERSYLLDGHYGRSNTLDRNRHILDRGNGRIDDDGPYKKLYGGHQGAVYVVAGNGSEARDEDLDHPAHVVSLAELGSLVLDINGDTLHGQMIGDRSGEDHDSFAIKKRDVHLSSNRNNGRITFDIKAQRAYAGMKFVVLGAHDNSSSFDVSFFNGTKTVPLTHDHFTNLTAINWIGTLDENGRGSLSYDIATTSLPDTFYAVALVVDARPGTTAGFAFGPSGVVEVDLR